VHQVSEDVLDHWFIRACIKENRVVVLAEEAGAPAAPQESKPEAASAGEGTAPQEAGSCEPLTEDALKRLTNAELEKLLREIKPDVSIPSGATKAQLIALVLELQPAQNAAQPDPGGAG
jgi:hypothetical protein